MEENVYGKCPFRKIIKSYNTTNELFDSIKEIAEEFADCLGTNCMAFKFPGYCKRMENNK